MAKDPAFLFYPNDWLGGTMTLTRYQKGCYIDLLMAQFNSGPLSLEAIKTLLGADHAQWAVLRAKFKQDAEGRFFNERMEAEKLKRLIFSESRKNNRIGKTKNKKNKELVNNTSKTYVKHMENGNENRNENEDEKLKYKNNVLLKKSEYEKLCADFGNKATDAAIEYLHLYKLEKNYITKSDYLSIRRWVMGAVNKTKNNDNKQTLNYIIATDGTKIYEKDIDFSKLGK
jgi:hypothetical protein